MGLIRADNPQSTSPEIRPRLRGSVQNFNSHAGQNYAPLASFFRALSFDLGVGPLLSLCTSNLTESSVLRYEVADSSALSFVEHDGKLVQLSLRSANAYQDVFKVFRPEFAVQ